MSFRYARHFARIFNRPLLLEPAAFEAMLPGINTVFRAGVLPEPEALVSVARERSRESGLRMDGPVAVVPAHGVLVHRGQYDAECNYLLGYQDIALMLRAAIDDPACATIVINADSPGGEVAGCFDLAALIAELAQIKPIHVAVNDKAASAMYALARAATSISVTRTANVGSIGVLLRHEDYSQYLEKLGVGVTLLYAGDHKVDGNPYEPLPQSVKEDLQAEIDALYGMFVDLVAANRSMDRQAVINTQARVYLGADAVVLGLADRVETPDALITRLAAEIRGGGQLSAATLAAPVTTETTMSTIPEAVCTALGLPSDASEAQAIAAIDQIRAQAKQEGAKAENERIFAILGSEEAGDRLPAAVALAGSEGVTPEAASTVLAKLPKQAKAVADNQFADHMAAMQPGQEVGAGEDEDLSEPQAIARLWGIARGRAVN